MEPRFKCHRCRERITRSADYKPIGAHNSQWARGICEPCARELMKAAGETPKEVKLVGQMLVMRGDLKSLTGRRWLAKPAPKEKSNEQPTQQQS